MKKTLRGAGLIAAVMLLLPAQFALAAEEVGYNHIPLPAQADTLLSVPFNPDPVGSFVVLSKTGLGVTVSNTLTVGAFNNTHYVRFTSGSGAGLPLNINENQANDFVLENWAVATTHVNVGDTFNVYKYPTLGSMFPRRMQGISHINGSTVLIFAPDITNMRQNLSAAKIAAYANGNWVGAGVNNNTPLKPETQFIFRNGSNQVLKYIPHGDVPQYTVRKLIAPNGDLTIGTGYPVAESLKNSGICGPGATGLQRQALLFDNTASGINKSATKVAACVNGNWVGAGVTGNELLKGSEAFTVRFPASEAGNIVAITKPYVDQQ